MVRFLLDNFDIIQWILTAGELGVGLLLVLGLASREAAVLALAQQSLLAVLYASSNRWIFEQPHSTSPRHTRSRPCRRDLGPRRAAAVAARVRRPVPVLDDGGIQRHACGPELRAPALEETADARDFGW